MLGVRLRMKARRGDTIVEVLFAITIFSIVSVAGISLMNKGMAVSQQSLEVTAVRQQIDGQAEALRFLNNAYISEYRASATYAASTPAGQYHSLLGKVGTTVTAFTAGASCAMPTTNRKFIVNTENGTVETDGSKFTTAKTAAQVRYASGVLQQSEGIWIEGVRSSAASSGGVGYVDFHIRACWDAPGQSVPMTLGTIVRFYDPR